MINCSKFLGDRSLFIKSKFGEEAVEKIGKSTQLQSHQIYNRTDGGEYFLENGLLGQRVVERKKYRYRIDKFWLGGS